MKKSFLVWVASFILLFAISSGTLAASISDFPDAPKDEEWSYQALSSMVENDLLVGYNGKLSPNGILSRAQFAAILVRASGATETADLSAFSDVAKKDWYYTDMAKAVQMKIIVGTSATTLDPEQDVTREQALTMLARFVALPNGDEASLEVFTDQKNISAWAKGSIAAMLENHYVNGFLDKTIRPQNATSRAEFAQMLFSIVKTYANTEKQEISSLDDGGILLSQNGITLKNVNVRGDLIVGDGSTKGTTTFDAISLTGRMVLRGGVSNEILLKNVTVDTVDVASAIGGTLTLKGENQKEIPLLRVDQAEDFQLSIATKKLSLSQGSKTTLAAAVDTVMIEADTTSNQKAELAVGKTASVKEITIADHAKAKIVLADPACDATFKIGQDADVAIVDNEGNPVAISGNQTTNYLMGLSIDQKKINESAATVTVKNISKWLDKGVTGLDVVGKIVLDGTAVTSQEQTLDLKKDGVINQKTDTWTSDIDLGLYGNITYTATMKQGDAAVIAATFVKPVNADSYNLAPLNASFPVIYFTLSLWDITKTSDGENVPTFVFLERDSAYDWTQLPENVYAQPGMEKDFHKNVSKMVAYTKNLYEANPEANFHLYCVDNYPEFLLRMLVANGVPEDQYRVSLLSDGVGSYLFFNSTFNVADPQEKYDEMKAEWEEIKAVTRETGEFDGTKLKYNDVKDHLMVRYPYVIANEDDNIDWWLARVSDTFILDAPTDKGAFLAAAKASPSIKIKNINTMLTELQNKGPEAVAAFKALYHFSDDMFSEAEEQGKKVMMILGTRVTGETNFSDYASFVMDYYGDDYIYYYKGHPGTPTGLYPEKQRELEALGITDVESSIAAELILFFYPDIYFCGYPTSVFHSAESAEKAAALFTISKANADASYGNMMDSFIFPINAGNATYGKYCVSGKSCYAVEYNDTTLYDFGIWNATDKTMTEYKNGAVVQ